MNRHDTPFRNRPEKRHRGNSPGTIRLPMAHGHDEPWQVSGSVMPPRKTSAKAITAAIGATLTALLTALATVTVAVGDDAIDAGEIISLTTAAATLATTVYAVWKIPNETNG